MGDDVCFWVGYLYGDYKSHTILLRIANREQRGRCAYTAIGD